MPSLQLVSYLRVRRQHPQWLACAASGIGEGEAHLIDIDEGFEPKPAKPVRKGAKA